MDLTNKTVTNITSQKEYHLIRYLDKNGFRNEAAHKMLTNNSFRFNNEDEIKNSFSWAFFEHNHRMEPSIHQIVYGLSDYYSNCINFEHRKNQ